MEKFESPAKINLTLHLHGKREDGYHELSSLMQAVSLRDTLHIEPGREDSLIITDPSIPTGPENLVWKAVRLFRRSTGISKKFSIRLEKRIPAEAGLGGGSGNAATTLFALNKILGTRFSDSELMEMGAKLGSDVPFFFSTGSALCRGRGELVEQRPPPALEKVTIVKPPYGLSTAEVYENFNLKKSERESGYFNALEEAAFSLRPELKQLKGALLDGGFETVLLSGSGSSLFCLGEGALPFLPDHLFYSAAFLNRSPDSWY